MPKNLCNPAIRSITPTTLIVLFALLLGASGQALATTTLFKATYEGEHSGWDITLHRTLTEQNGTYLFSSHAKNLFASMEETSEFRIANNTIKPDKYSYFRKVFGRKTLETIEFDWPASVARYRRSNRKKNNTDHPLTSPTLDPSVYQLMLQADAANQAEAYHYPLIKRKARKRYQFTPSAEKGQFTLGKKQYQATVLEYKDIKRKKSTKVWILPDLDFQIGKIVHTDEDDTFQIELTEYSAAPHAMNRFYNQLRVPIEASREQD